MSIPKHLSMNSLIVRIGEFCKLAGLGVGFDELEKFVSSDDNPKYFFHLSDLERFGINVQSKFGTPFGIYAYPLTAEFLEMLKRGRLPFAGERKYVHIFSLNVATNNIKNYGKNDYEKDLSILKKMYGIDEKFIDDCETEAYEQNYISYFWNVTRKVSGGNIREWSRVFKNLGYTNFYDPGMGVIHINEKQQILVVDPGVIVYLDIFENPFGAEKVIERGVRDIRREMFELQSMDSKDIKYKEKAEKILTQLNPVEVFKGKLNDKILKFMYDYGGETWKGYLATYPGTPEWMLDAMGSGSNYFILERLAGNGKISDLVFNKLLRMKSDEIKERLFLNSVGDERIDLAWNALGIDSKRNVVRYGGSRHGDKFKFIINKIGGNEYQLNDLGSLLLSRKDIGSDVIDLIVDYSIEMNDYDLLNYAVGNANTEYTTLKKIYIKVLDVLGGGRATYKNTLLGILNRMKIHRNIGDLFDGVMDLLEKYQL